MEKARRRRLQGVGAAMFCLLSGRSLSRRPGWRVVSVWRTGRPLAWWEWRRMDRPRTSIPQRAHGPNAPSHAARSRRTSLAGFGLPLLFGFEMAQKNRPGRQGAARGGKGRHDQLRYRRGRLPHARC